MKGSIQSLEVSYLLHSTEDPKKAHGAVAALLGFEPQSEIESLEGHFGNEILRTRVHLTGDEAESAFRRVISRMLPEMKVEIASKIGSFLDEHAALFLRLDKQRLVSGEVAFGSGDSVRVKVKPRVFLLKEGAPRFYLRLIGGK